MTAKPPIDPAHDDRNVVVTPETAAEAAVWIARLHGPSRSPEMERKFREWQARSAAHRKAFEATTDVWEMVPRIGVADAFAAVQANAKSSASRDDARGGRGGYGAASARRRRLLALAIPLIAVAGFAGYRLTMQGDAYATGVGEQQLVVLADGSRMTLNTDTKVRVKLRDDRRSVEVEQGEALFEVAKDPHRPFVVRAGGTEVEAVGTVFAVRLADGGDRLADKLAVTLVEGVVNVRADPSAWVSGLAPKAPVVMHAGERIRLDKASMSEGQTRQQLDRPHMDRLLAWKQNKAVFDDVRLADAVAEMNRYSRMPIVLSGAASLADLHLSGQFATGDSLAFAQAICALHGLTLKQSPERLELSLPH